MPGGELNVQIDHDVVLEASDGRRIGLMLYRPFSEDGQALAKSWEVNEIPTPTSIRVSEVGLSPTDFPPEMAATVFRETNIDGMSAGDTRTGQQDYHSGAVVSSIPGKLLKPPSVNEIALTPTSGAAPGDIRAWLEYKGKLYVADGRYLYSSSDGVTFAQVLDAGSKNRITSLTEFGASSGVDHLIIGREIVATQAGVRYQLTANGEDFTLGPNEAGGTARHFVVRNEILWGLSDHNSARSTKDPTAVWSAITVVGDQASRFRGGVVSGASVIFFKEDGAYTLTGTGDIEPLIDVAGFEQAITGPRSNIFFTADEEVWEYDPFNGSLRQLNLLALADSDLNAQGCPGIAYDGRALFALHTNYLPPTGSSLIRIGFNGDIPAVERWLQQTPRGHRPQGPLYFSSLFTRTTTGRHLWAATETAGVVARVNLFRSEDPTMDTVSEYTNVDSLYRSGWMVHGFPSDLKDYASVAVHATSLSGSPPASTYSVYYYLDGDTHTRYTLVENVGLNGVHAHNFDTGTTGVSFMLELLLVSENSALSPVVFSWAVRSSVKFEQREIIDLAVRVKDYVPLRTGGQSPYTTRQIRDTLRGLRQAKGVKISYNDYRGYSFSNIRILPGFREVDLMDEKLGANETVMRFRIMRVSPDESNVFAVGDFISGPRLIGTT